MLEDHLCLADEEHPGGEGLLEEVVRKGRRVKPADPLQAIRQRVEGDIRRLPEACKDLREPHRYPVRISPSLQDLEEQTTRRLRREELG
jgi:hypothetical protein